MRRANLPVFLALALLLALAAMLAGWWLGPLLFRGGPPPSPAGEAGGQASRGPLSFSELAALLEAEAAGPAGARFAREFAAKPRLRRLWTDFLDRAAQSRARQQAGPSAQEFLRELRREKEFAEVFSRLSGDRAFRALAERLAAESALTEALRAGLAGAAAPAGASEPERRPSSSGKVFGLYATDGAPGPGASAPPAAGQPGATDAPKSRATRGPSEPRIEGHWVHDGGPIDMMAVCRQIGGAEACRRAAADCRRDPACAKRLVGYERMAGGGVGKSTAPARGARDEAPPAQPAGRPER